MSPGAGTAKKRLGVAKGVVAGGGGFTLGCGCRDAKAVAASAASASPYSAAAPTETPTTTTTAASTATTATWRGARTTTHPSSASAGSLSTGTLTVPSASSSSFFQWEDADADAEGDGDTGEEVNCKQESSAATVGFSGLLRQLNELEQSVVSWGRKSTSSGKDYFSSPPPPPLPARPVKQRAVHSGGGDSKEGHGNFSPPPLPATTSFQFHISQQQHRKAKSMEKADRQVDLVHSKQPPPPPPPPPLPLPKEEQLKVKSADDKGVKKKDDANMFPTPQAASNHRKAKSCDAGPGPVRLDGSVGVGVAVVKHSDDPLSDFRRSMVNMIVENRIVTGDELRELLRHFLALNAPRHHDAILRAFTEIWDEAFSAKTTAASHGRCEPVAARTTNTTPPRPRPRAPTPPRRRHAPPPRAWR